MKANLAVKGRCEKIQKKRTTHINKFITNSYNFTLTSPSHFKKMLETDTKDTFLQEFNERKSRYIIFIYQLLLKNETSNNKKRKVENRFNYF